MNEVHIMHKLIAASDPQQQSFFFLKKYFPNSPEHQLEENQNSLLNVTLTICPATQLRENKQGKTRRNRNNSDSFHRSTRRNIEFMMGKMNKKGTAITANSALISNQEFKKDSIFCKYKCQISSPVHSADGSLV